MIVTGLQFRNMDIRADNRINMLIIVGEKEAVSINSCNNHQRLKTSLRLKFSINYNMLIEQRNQHWMVKVSDTRSGWLSSVYAYTIHCTGFKEKVRTVNSVDYYWTDPSVAVISATRGRCYIMRISCYLLINSLTCCLFRGNKTMMVTLNFTE